MSSLPLRVGQMPAGQRDNPQQGRVVPLAPTQPLALPKQAVLAPVKTRSEQANDESTDTVETAWAATDEAYDAAEQGLRRKNRWNGFQGQRGGHAALLAALQGRSSGPGPFLAPDTRLGEPALNYFMRFSAALNEYYRAHGEQVGISPYGFSPGDEPSSVARRSGFRRQFALE